MFSADSIGVVMIWNSLIHPQADTKRKRRGTGGKKPANSISRFIDEDLCYLIYLFHDSCHFLLSSSSSVFRFNLLSSYSSPSIIVIVIVIFKLVLPCHD